VGKTPGSREAARGGYLFSQTALATVFAAKFKAALARAGLPVPSELIAELPKHWVVDCKAVGDGQAALRYLGRYLYRGVIQEADILGCQDGQVRYRWRDAKSGKQATRSLPGADFLWLLLQHVLPRGLQRTRNFGFLHHNSRRLLGLLQLTQGVPVLPPQPPPERPVWRCACGQPMRILRRRMRPEEAAAVAAANAATAAAAPRTVRPDQPQPAQAAKH
jgi:hypothetical protein